MVSKNTKVNEIASTIPSEVCDNDDKKVKKPETWRLYNYEEAPAFLRLNQFIRTGYRVRLSYSWCLRSLFKVHNETMNCWTHLLSLLIFVGLSIHTLFIFLDKHSPNGASLSYFFFDPAGPIPVGDSMLLHRAIFALYFIAAQGCFLCSTMYHLFSCHSEHTLCSVARLDYSGISGLILASFYPPVYYLYYCFPAYQALYLGTITFLGLVGMFGPLFSFFHAHWFHPFRVMLFVGTTCSGFVPAVHSWYIPQLDKLGYNLGPDVPAFEECFYLLVAMFALYGIGFVFYITKTPERFFPGKFDHWFHSHSIWHIFVFAATYAHYLNCVKLFERWNAQQDSCPIIQNTYYGTL